MPHVRGGGAALVDDPVGVHRADARAAARPSLQTRRLDQAPGEVARWIGEDAARGRKVKGLGALAVAEVGLHRGARTLEPFLVGAPKADANARHHAAFRQMAAAVGPVQLVALEPPGAL